MRHPKAPFPYAAVLAVLGLLPQCSGGANPAAPPPTTPTPVPTVSAAPAKLSDLSAAVTSPQADTAMNCDGNVRARVTLTNRSAGNVTVIGVLKSVGIPAGDCRGGSDFTYTPATRVALGNSTTVVLDQLLYTSGPGCCLGKGCAGSCRFQEMFQVLTEAGNVPAGSFNYQVFFQNCRSCATVGAAAGGACRAVGMLP